MDFIRKTLDATHYIYVPRQCPYPEIAQAMESGFKEVFGFVGSARIRPLSMPMSLYPAMPSEEVAFHAGVMVSAEDAAKAEGTIKAAELPAGEVMMATHVGPYDRMHETHQALWAHMETAGIPAAMPVWEVYVDDPGDTAPKALRTEIYRAIG